MTRCPYPGSGCNGPKESDCVGLPACIGFSFHRVNTETMTKRCAAIKGNVEPRTEPTVLDAYKTHRPRGRMKALIHAWKRFVRAFRTRHIPDPFKEHA